MAISLLTSGNSGAVNTNATTTQSVSVTTGNGNRKLLVGVSLEDATGNAAPASVTFNGQDLVALGLEVSGTNQNPDSVARTVFYEQFEGGMPADGASDLSVTWTATTGGAIVCYWLVDGAHQGQLATGAGNAITAGAGTTVGTSISAADTGSFLASVAYKNNATGTLALTAPASATANGDASVTGGARCAGASRLGLTAGSNTVTWTHSSETRRCVSAVVVNPAPNEANASGALTFTSEVAGTMDSPRNASGDLAFATSIDIDADFLIEAGGGALTFATQVDGALSVPVNLSGALAFGWSIGDAVLDVEGTVLSGAIEFASQVSGSLSVPAEASGALAFSTSFDVDADFIIEADGALQFGWSVAGSLAHVSSASGSLAFAASVTGRVQTQFPGSCVLLDEPAGSVQLDDEPAFAATLLDEPAGTATLEFST